MWTSLNRFEKPCFEVGQDWALHVQFSLRLRKVQALQMLPISSKAFWRPKLPSRTGCWICHVRADSYRPRRFRKIMHTDWWWLMKLSSAQLHFGNSSWNLYKFVWLSLICNPKSSPNIYIHRRCFPWWTWDSNQKCKDHSHSLSLSDFSPKDVRFMDIGNIGIVNYSITYFIPFDTFSLPGTPIRVTRAPQPTDIIWENQEMGVLPAFWQGACTDGSWKNANSETHKVTDWNKSRALCFSEEALALLSRDFWRVTGRTLAFSIVFSGKFLCVLTLNYGTCCQVMNTPYEHGWWVIFF